MNKIDRQQAKSRFMAWFGLAMMLVNIALFVFTDENNSEALQFWAFLILIGFALNTTGLWCWVVVWADTKLTRRYDEMKLRWEEEKR